MWRIVILAAPFAVDKTSDKYAGNPENWKVPQTALEKVCKEMQLPDLEIVEGEAAFY